jgi:hypothetical protein
MDISAILKVVDWYLDIYNGAEGKLTVASHKIDILKVRIKFTTKSDILNKTYY